MGISLAGGISGGDSWVAHKKIRPKPLARGAWRLGADPEKKWGIQTDTGTPRWRRFPRTGRRFGT